MMASRLGRWRRVWSNGFGVTPRLLGLSLVPVVGLLLFALPTVSDRLAVADRAEQVQAEVDQLAGLAAVRMAVLRERVPTQALMRASSVGVSSSQASALLGMEIDAQLTRDALVTDDAVRALGVESPVSIADVQDLRRRAAALEIDADAYLEVLEAFDQRLVEASDRELEVIRALSSTTSSASALDDGLDALRWSSVAIDASNGQLNAVMWLAMGTGDTRALTNDLAAATAHQSSVKVELDVVTDATIADAWRMVEQTPSTLRYDETVAHMLRYGPPPIVEGLERVAAVSRDGLAYQESVFTFAETVATVLRDAATRLRDDTLADARRTAAGTTVLVTIILAISVFFGRSISKPLRRLAHQASALSAGDLDRDLSVAIQSGPRDIVVTSTAFDDLVTNLRLLDAKAHALAACDFDAPVLAQTAPGSLGKSLQVSAELLSGSIIERDVLQRRIAHEATHDGLTGLYNRAGVSGLLTQILVRSRRNGSGVAVVLADLDGFHRLNDTMGQSAGDTVLGQVASALQATVRADEVIARVGSDEFMVIAEQIHDVDDAGALARRLSAAIATPVEVDGTTLTTSGCLGIALVLDHDTEAEALVTSAHVALQRARKRGPGSTEVFDEEMQRHLDEQAAVANALAGAMKNNELLLQYQPVLELDTYQMVSVEGLVRWDRPGLGRQPPDSFIPVAEASNLIVDVDRWVLHRAAHQLLAWRDHPRLNSIAVAVNISGRHLQCERLDRHVDEILATIDVDPTKLIIEVTETVLVEDVEAVARQLAAVRDRGIRVAIDDFGTGFTSITHLQHLPADILKIDRAFVARANETRDRRLLAMVTDLGHHLGMTITAEGVETTDQLEVLRELGCDHVQGYLFSRPLDTPSLEAWVPHRPASAQPVGDTA